MPAQAPHRRSAHAPRRPTMGRPAARRVRGSLTSTLRSVAIALSWVLLGLGSLAACVVSLWIVASLAKAAAGPSGGAVWPWLIAVVITLLVPFAIATWKHQGDPRRISLTMAWLPMLWNAGGLLIATQIIPDIMGSALRGQGAWVVSGNLGDSHSATRVMSALGHHTADFVDPQPMSQQAARGSRAPALGLGHDAEVDMSKAISVPFTEEGTAILMDVTLEGPEDAVALPYLFDTGASFTTISAETAQRLGVAVPEDAPTLTFNTASGPRESRMVHLPALRLGEVYIEGLLVSVCDACVNERTEGLLGLNVMREFFVQMDYKNERMVLLPRIESERPNRAYDIEPVVELQVEGPAEVWLGRVHWKVEVHNRGTVPLQDVIPVVKFTDGPTLLGKKVERIDPGQVGRSLVDGRATLGGRGGSKGHYTLGLAEAYW